MVVDRGKGDMIRVQCKFARVNKEKQKFSISMRTNNKRYGKDEVDYFATVVNNKCYLVPYEENKSSVILNFLPPKNNQKKFVKFAQDYYIGDCI